MDKRIRKGRKIYGVKKALKHTVGRTSRMACSSWELVRLLLKSNRAYEL